MAGHGKSRTYHDRHCGENSAGGGHHPDASGCLGFVCFPGGVEVLAIEWERAKRSIRRTHLFLLGKSPLLTKRSL